MIHLPLSRRSAVLAAGLLFAALALSGPAAHADQSAINFLAPYAQAGQNYGSQSVYYGLTAALVSNQSNGLVSYTGPVALGFYNTTRLVKEGQFYVSVHSEGFSGSSGESFNDRDWGPLDLINPLKSLGYKITPPSVPTLNAYSFPFDPYAQDNLGISLDALTGAVTLTLKSWGSTTVTMDLHAQNGILIGTGYTIGNSGGPGTVLISVAKYFDPPPPNK